MGKKILIVDDEKKIVKVVRGYLEQAAFSVVVACDGKQALTVFRHEKPDLVLLDLNLPEMDGLDVARALRQDSSVPIIMLTARIEETDRLIGLELGADDYVTKPFSPREVVARVRTVLRRVEGQTATIEILRAGAIELDATTHTVTVLGKPAELTPTEFDLLKVLILTPGRVYTRLQLLDQVQGETYDGYERTVDAHIKNLRRKIGDDPKQPHIILTVFGIGYKFAEGM
ncbi:MAG: response regulator transcription factor [Chloroflexi bacterium]|nr:response regulator transcription factor [Chloroflexota bacterium]